MKRFTLLFALMSPIIGMLSVFTVAQAGSPNLIVAMSSLNQSFLTETTAGAAEQTPTRQSTWGGLKAIYDKKAEITPDVVQRASGILHQDSPSAEDQAWMDAFTSEQRDEIIHQMIPIRRIPGMQNMSHGRLPATPNATSAYWEGEWIEKQAGGGSGCYTNAFWNAPTGQCSKSWEFPPDKVFSFPCSNLPGKASIRIYSSNWQINWVLGSGVSSRVYYDHVEICIGYWTLYYTGTNPYSLLGRTYIYW